MSDSELGRIARAKRHVKAADAIVKEAERQGRRMSVGEGEQCWHHIHEAQRLRDDEKLQEKIERMRNANSEALSPGAGAGSFAKALLDERFDLKTNPTVIVSAAKALGIKAPTTPAVGTWNERTEPAVVPMGADRRFIFNNLPTLNAGEATAVADFRITARATTGTVQRSPDAVTDKATVNHVIAHVTEDLPQHAVVVPDVPNALLESIAQMRAILESEGRLAVEQSIDAHTYSQLTAGAPFGSTGANLVEQVRNAVAAMRTSGMSPNLLILDPADAVTLDLFADAGGYVFGVRDSGSSSPLWNLRVVESVAAVGSDPLLVDTSRIGVLYLGGMRIDADPYSGFRQNLTTLRIETTALCHVRAATAAYRIGV